MKWFFPYMLFALFASEAGAQDISIHMDEIGAGSYVVYQRNGKEFVTHVFRGKRGSNYIYDVIDGKSPNGDRLFRYLRDSLGQSRTLISAKDNEITYKPHNCMRTIGTCHYTEMGPNFSSKMIRINTSIRGGFKFEQYAVSENGTRTLVRKGKVFLDAKGMMLKGTLLPAGGSKLRFVQKGAAYR